MPFIAGASALWKTAVYLFSSAELESDSSCIGRCAPPLRLKLLPSVLSPTAPYSPSLLMRLVLKLLPALRNPAPVPPGATLLSSFLLIRNACSSQLLKFRTLSADAFFDSVFLTCLVLVESGP